MALLYKKDSIAYEDAVTALLSDELTNKDSNEFIKEARSILYVEISDANKGRSLQKENESRSRSRLRGKSKLLCFYYRKQCHFKKD